MKKHQVSRNIASVGGACLAIVAIVSGITYVAADREGNDGIGEPAGEPETSEVVHPLDPIPGFGKGHEARQRDDAIALWEAYRREASMVDCMKMAGFDYFADLRGGVEDLQKATDYMGMQTDLGSAPNLDGKQNDDVKRGMDADSLNRYHLALYGVTWDDISAETGDIDNTGCFADSMVQVGTVWSVKDKLAPERTDMNRAVLETEPMKLAQAEYARCADETSGVKASNQGELEALGVDPEVVDQVVERCDPAFDAARAEEIARLEAAFLSKHPELMEHAAKYEDARATMASDDGFLQAIGIQ